MTESTESECTYTPQSQRGGYTLHTLFVKKRFENQPVLNLEHAFKMLLLTFVAIVFHAKLRSILYSFVLR